MTMTNNTIPNVPRVLLVALLDEGSRKETWAAQDKVRAILSAPSPDGVDGLEVIGWVSDIGSFILSKNGKEAGCNEPFFDADLCRLSDAQAIIDGLRGEVERLREERDSFQRVGIRTMEQRDRLAGLLLYIRRNNASSLSTSMIKSIAATLSAGKEGK